MINLIFNFKLFLKVAAAMLSGYTMIGSNEKADNIEPSAPIEKVYILQDSSENIEKETDCIESNILFFNSNSESQIQYPKLVPVKVNITRDLKKTDISKNEKKYLVVL